MPIYLIELKNIKKKTINTEFFMLMMLPVTVYNLSNYMGELPRRALNEPGNVWTVGHIRVNSNNS